MDDDLRRLIERVLSDIAADADAYLGQRITPTTWARVMEERLTDAHRAAYLLGADTRTLSPQARAFLAKTIASQVKYLHGFTQDLRSESMTPALMKARAALYAGPLKATYSRAKWWGWPLPFHPADGDTPCLVNCTCSWEGRDLNVGTKDGTFYWRLATHPHAENCPGCVDRAQAGAPYLVRGGKLQ